MKLSIDLTPEQLAVLRAALAPTPSEIEAIALALLHRMRTEQMSMSSSMTVPEFAKLARITPSWVHTLIRDGKLEATNPGGGRGNRRITAESAAKYFAGGEHGNGG